jgi:hypothetical protein
MLNETLYVVARHRRPRWSAWLWRVCDAEGRRVILESDAISLSIDVFVEITVSLAVAVGIVGCIEK